jgi:S-formylglutathione hydrolase
MTLETISTNRSFGGTQGVYAHDSSQTGIAHGLFRLCA